MPAEFRRSGWLKPLKKGEGSRKHKCIAFPLHHESLGDWKKERLGHLFVGTEWGGGKEGKRNQVGGHYTNEERSSWYLRP